MPLAGRLELFKFSKNPRPMVGGGDIDIGKRKGLSVLHRDEVNSVEKAFYYDRMLELVMLVNGIVYDYGSPTLPFF